MSVTLLPALHSLAAVVYTAHLVELPAACHVPVISPPPPRPPHPTPPPPGAPPHCNLINDSLQSQCAPGHGHTQWR